jgi:hypothetical protein
MEVRAEAERDVMRMASLLLIRIKLNEWECREYSNIFDINGRHPLDHLPNPPLGNLFYLSYILANLGEINGDENIRLGRNYKKELEFLEARLEEFGKELGEKTGVSLSGSGLDLVKNQIAVLEKLGPDRYRCAP